VGTKGFWKKPLSGMLVIKTFENQII